MKGLYYKDIKIADEGYIINLPERTDRKKETEDLLNSLGFKGFEFVPGVRLEDPELKKMGCTQAFTNIFKKFLEGNSKDIIIFEDDIKLIETVTEDDLDDIFKDWNEIVNHYDVFSLGTNFIEKTTIFKHNGRNHGSFERTLCAHAFLYKRNFVEYYVSLMDGNLNPNHEFYKQPIDIFLNDSSSYSCRFINSNSLKKFNFGVSVPMVFSQRDSYSDNESYFQNYDQIMQKGYWDKVLHERAYVLYSDELYFNTVTEACRSIREFSDLPIFVYMLNSDKKIDIKDTLTVKWECDIYDQNKEIGDKNYFINRSDPNIYKLLIQRPLIVKDALKRFAKNIAYIDSDSVATFEVDRIFDFFDSESDFPYFVEGIYDYLHYNGRGGAESKEDLSTTLEAPACELFNVDQSVRQRYRQTGYFVSGKNCIDFLDEWYEMCINPEVMKNHVHYAPFHEETIVNVLLYKKNIHKGLPYLYANGTLETINKMYNEVKYLGANFINFVGDWLRAPQDKETLLFFHGEKRPEIMNKMIEEIKKNNIKNKYNIDGSKNWGDIISKVVIDHFSPVKIKEDDVMSFDPKYNTFNKNGKLQAIGSVLRFTKPNDYIWGAGALTEGIVGDKPKKIYAVRGPLTREQYLNYGIECPEVYGDPALLFPQVYDPKVNKKYKYGIIPHYADFDYSSAIRTIDHLEKNGIKVINITAGIYEFIDELKECEFIMSTSLHGCIAADAYQIPNIRVGLCEWKSFNDFKFKDYFLSVKREVKDQYDFIDEKTTIEEIEKLKFESGDISIVEGLLENAPWLDPECPFFKNKIRVLFLAPHLSTGGMPAYVLKKIETLQEYSKNIDIYVAEYSMYSNTYVTQRNRIIEIVPENRFFNIGGIGGDKSELINIIKNNNIDILHVDEIFEGFDSFNQVPDNILKEIYSNDRTWKVVETCHNVWFNPDKSKKFSPDAYAFCTPYHPAVQFVNETSYNEVFEFPIENKRPSDDYKEQMINELGLDPNKKHILNVGIWTSGKNQKEGIEIARTLEKTNPELHFHFLGNQAVNFKEYWEPIMSNLPSNVTVWGERSDVDKFMSASDLFMFNSTWECNPLVLREAISHGLKIIARNLPQYMNMFKDYIHNLTDSIVDNSKLLLDVLNSNTEYEIPENQAEKFALDFESFYKKVNNNPIKKQEVMNSNISVNQHFVSNPFLEIKGDSTNDNDYKIKFYDENDICVYDNSVKVNHWVKLNREYYTKWRTKVWENDKLIYDNTLNYEGKRVYISFDSKSLGDTIAWIPYCLEFKKKHNCDVIVSTFWNNLFKDVYPELEFVLPGFVVPNIYGMYKIGWFYDDKKEPELPNTIPLQKTITNILGLGYEEIIPEINFKPKNNPYKQKYVTIATNSTAGLKFWQKEDWIKLIDFLNSKGYKVINVSKEKNEFKNAEQIKDSSIENTMNVIHHSEFFIGLSSGLSWLAWALKKQVVMIANFTEPDHEFQKNCIRIINHNVCNSCWNNPNFKFDKGDWNWCPIWKNTERQFECHKSITADMVIENIKTLL